jgi:hypothetical protein
MEYIDGEDLKQIVERNGPLEVKMAAKIIHDAATGLAYIHEKGHVHRDIKPSNLMISKHGEVKVLDLGLARCISPDRQASFVSMPGLVGSFDYMSPEQCREERDVDARADIYSLGCTMYFLVNGSPPFAAAKSIFQKLNSHQQLPHPRVPRLASQPEFEKILDRMLAKELRERYPSLRNVVAALRPFAQGVHLESLVQTERRVARSPSDNTGSTIPLPGRAETPAEYTTLDRLRPSTWTRRRWLAAGAAAAGVAGSGGVAFYLLRRPPEPSVRFLNFVGTLPGLNGRWWFDEAPWLLPEVRLELARALGSDGDSIADALFAVAVSSAATGLYAELLAHADATRPAWPQETRRRYSSLRRVDPERLGDEKVAEVAKDFADRLRSAAQDELSGSDLHLLAIVQHHADDVAAANAAYEAAEKRYEREGQRALRALCLADWGQLRLRERRPALAHDKFARAREVLAESSAAPRDLELTDLFRGDALCWEGDAHRGYTNWEPARALLAEATRLAAGLPDDHPQRALCHERLGWYHLDVWRLAAAGRDFDRAIACRSRHDREENHRALHFLYWNRQGRAMVDFYEGQISRAAGTLRQMLDEIRTSSKITTRQREELKQRRPNLLERLADAVLVEPSQAVEAHRVLAEAVRVARDEERFDSDARWPVLIRLMYKTALAAALAGEGREAQRLLETAREQVRNFESKAPIDFAGGPLAALRPADARRKQAGYGLTRELAESVVEWRARSGALLDRARQTLVAHLGRNPASVSRDELLLLLVVAERLLVDPATPAAMREEAAGYLATLAAVEPKGKPADSTPDSQPWRRPRLFQRYADVAARHRLSPERKRAERDART